MVLFRRVVVFGRVYGRGGRFVDIFIFFIYRRVCRWYVVICIIIWVLMWVEIYVDIFIGYVSG